MDRRVTEIAPRSESVASVRDSVSGLMPRSSATTLRGRAAFRGVFTSSRIHRATRCTALPSAPARRGASAAIACSTQSSTAREASGCVASHTAISARGAPQTTTSSTARALSA